MVTFRERNNPVRLLGRRLLLAILAAAILFMIPGVWKVYVQERESRRLKNEAVQALTDLEGRQKHLQEKTAALDTPRGLEEALREQFSLGRADEDLIIVVDRPRPEVPVEPANGLMRLFDQILHR